MTNTHPPSPKPPHVRTQTKEKGDFIQTNHPAKVLKISCHAVTHYVTLCCAHTHTDGFTRVSSACFIIATDKTDACKTVRVLCFCFKRGRISQLIAHIAVKGLSNTGIQSVMRGAEENNSWRTVGVK